MSATRDATNHSPLPWSIGRNDRVECANGHVVADMTFSSHSERRASANAALIVTAVNEHERLREALRQAREFICVQTWRPDQPRTANYGIRPKQALGLIARIDAALSDQKG